MGILTTGSMRVVKRNERGVVVSRKRYSRGDEVTKDVVGEERYEALIANGNLVEGDLAESGVNAVNLTTTTVASGGSQVTQPPRGPGGDVSHADAGGDPEDDIEADPNSGGDRYDGMTYPALQQEAKARTGDGTGGAEALKARLRSQDGIDDDEDVDDDDLGDDDDDEN